MKVDTAEGANGDSSGALRDRRRSGMNGAFAARPPSILADSITTPICVHERTKLNRLIHSDGLATETGDQARASCSDGSTTRSMLTPVTRPIIVASAG